MKYSEIKPYLNKGEVVTREGLAPVNIKFIWIKPTLLMPESLTNSLLKKAIFFGNKERPTNVLINARLDAVINNKEVIVNYQLTETDLTANDWIIL
jgi:hypothetical protein